MKREATATHAVEMQTEPSVLCPSSVLAIRLAVHYQAHREAVAVCLCFI